MPEQDILVFENSVSDQVEPIIFNEKKYNFIVDSTSNSGVFNSGQVQFDLQTFSATQFVDLVEGVIQMPIKVTATLTTAPVGSSTNAALFAGVLSSINKSGFHQWINNASLILNGQTIQSQQPLENVAATYRILSSWSKDTLTKWGDSCGVALDDCTADGNATTTLASTVGFENAAAATIADSIRGLDTTNSNAVLFNKGVVTRAHKQNTNTVAGSLEVALLGSTAIKASGKSNVQTLVAGSATVNTGLYSFFAMACIRVRDLFDIDQLPATKNIKGYIYLGYNSTQIDITGGASNIVATATVTPLTGSTCPITIHTAAVGGDTGTALSTGLSMTAPTGTGLTYPKVTFTANVDGTTTGAIGNSGPLLSNARLLVPYYNGNPKTDAAMTKVKEFTTLEKIVNPFNITAGENKNHIITVGVPNPQRLVLVPMFQKLGACTTLTNPELSAFDQTPATTGAHTKLDNVQVTVANKPLFQYPIQYDYEQWVENISQTGLNGNFTNEMTSGLLSQSMWRQNHRYYTFDLSRCLPSDDGQSRAVQVSCTNPSSGYDMKVIAILFYEKKWKINTATCQVESA
jgi:hypothetical protein